MLHKRFDIDLMQHPLNTIIMYNNSNPATCNFRKTAADSNEQLFKLQLLQIRYASSFNALDALDFEFVSHSFNHHAIMRIN